MSKLTDLGVQAFVEAYKKTGLKPIEGMFYVKNFEEHGECGCGLTAIAMSTIEDINPERTSVMVANMRTAYDLSEQDIVSFYFGFDNNIRSFDEQCNDNEHYKFGKKVRIAVEQEIGFMLNVEG